MSGSNYTLTPNYGFYLPVPNADNDVWGDHVNQNTSSLDGLLKTIQNTSGVTSFNTRTSAVTLNTADVTTVLPPSAGTPAMDGTPTPGTVNTWSRGDHVHPTDTTRYAASNPAGYVTASGAATAAPVQSVATRTGAVVLTHTDITDWAATLAPYAPLASPALTGNPTAPTPAPGDADTSIATTAFVQAAVAPMTNNVGRNLIHNPLFNVAQRGAGPWAAGGYALDRWILLFSGGDALTVSQSAMSDTQRAAIGDEAAVQCLFGVFTGTATAGSYSLIQNRIESVRRLSGKTVTISLWAVAAAGTPRLGISLDQIMGAGGSPSADVNVLGQSFLISTTFARYSVTLTLPSLSGKTLGTSGNDSTALSIWYSSGATNAARSGNVGVQSASIAIWGVQLEIGSVATPLEKPDPQQDLAKCQRFYQFHHALMIAGYQATGGIVYASHLYPVQMRAQPTITWTNQTYSNASGLANTTNNADSMSSQIIVTATALGWGIGDVALSADL